MKKLLALLFVCTLSLAFSQSNASKNNTKDSSIQSAESMIQELVPQALMEELYRYNPSSAYQLFNASKKLYADKGEDIAKSWTLDCIGEIYFEQKNYTTAFDYHSKALEINLKLNEKSATAHNLKNIGKALEKQKKYDEALEYFNDSEQMSREINDIVEMANTSINIGYIYFTTQLFPKALEYYTSGLENLRKVNDAKGIAIATCNLGEYYIQQNNNQHAVTYLEESYRISEELGLPELIKHSAHLLSLAYEKKGDGLLSVKLYKRYAFMKDSVEHDQNRKMAIRKEVQVEFEKNLMVAEQLKKENVRKENNRIQRRNGMQYSMIFAVILMVFGITALMGFVKVSPYLAEGFIFVSVLILFEFLLVLTDPYVDGVTNGIPIYKLVMNTLLAILVFPLHALFEKKLRKKIKK